MQEIRFDDMAALEAAVSEEFGEFGDSIEVSQEMINAFAELTGDRQWIHIDVERAIKESPFGGPVAHGFLTLSLLPKLSQKMPLRIVGSSATINYGAEGLRFLAPVPAGAKIHARSRLAKVAAKSGGAVLTMEWDVRVVGADKPSLLYGMQLLYR